MRSTWTWTWTALLALLAAAPARGADEDEKKTPARPSIYDAEADAAADIEAACARAARENRRVLIQWGADWCGWCHLLHDLFQGNPDVREKLQYEYEVVRVDVGRMDKNQDLAERYGADLRGAGIPFLTILDAKGDVIVNQETSSLEAGDRHDPAAVLAFLKEHQAPYPQAKDLLRAGKARAAAEGKRVFLHFGAPWCGNCHQLERWMARDDVRPLLAREFVDLKIDIDRTQGGRRLLDRTRTGEPGGIPRFTFLAPDGTKLVESNRADGRNVGFPTSAEDLAHVRTMLETGAVHLTADDVDALIDTLR